MQRVIFHVPHDGNKCPKELMKSVCIPKKRFLHYQKAMQDIDVRKFIPPKSERVCFEVSRLLCDVERFIDDSEIMNQYGMGFCYEKVFDGTKIKTITPDILRTTMKYYSAHHKKLDEIATTTKGKLFIIDLHSFSDEIVMNKKSCEQYPDICLGYDEVYCEPSIVHNIERLCNQSGYTVAINYPYQGSFVPNVFLKNGLNNCNSIMIELNRRIYRTKDQTNKVAVLKLQNLLTRIVADLKQK